MLKEIGEHVPNIDDYSVDPDDYKTLSQEFTKIARAFDRLANYAILKKSAMTERKEGRVNSLERVEKLMEKVYKQLPQEFRW